MARRNPSGGDTYQRGELRAALLDAVITITRESGIDAVTVRSVAKRVGVSEAAPYHHFDNKADLLGAAAALAFGHFAETLEPALARADAAGDDPAVALAREYVSFGLGNPGEYGLMFGRHVEDLELSSRTETRAAGGASRRLFIGALDESLRRREKDITGVEAFPLAWALLHGTVSLVQERELGPDMADAAATALAGQGIAALLGGLD